MVYDVIVVGGGIAGITSAAYLVKKGYKVLLLEKEKNLGGLVNSFVYCDFLFDGGARGIVDSGIVKPMLKDLGIELEMVKSDVSIIIEDQQVKVGDLDYLKKYRDILVNIYPKNEGDIDKIIAEIKRIIDYMSVIYGIENPLFKDLKRDRKFVFKKLIPWLFKFAAKIGKIKKYNIPVEKYLKNFTNNQQLIDIICQHFFVDTPASFALSYFSLYNDYWYPSKGTGEIIEKLQDYILTRGGEIEKGCKVIKIDVVNKRVYDERERVYQYRKLIWAADQTQLYNGIILDNIADQKMVQGIINRKEFIKGKRGSDTIFTVFLGVDLDSDYFAKRGTGHVFYTPQKQGQSPIFSKLKEVKKSADKEEIFKWVKDYLEYTTYEIAIPALRNRELAPQGKTGLIVSVLLDYDLVKNVDTLGFYQDFKEFTEKQIISVLNRGIYIGISDQILVKFSSSPLTIERLTGNLDGAITGWAFSNTEIPSVSEMLKIKKSALTPIPHIYQAGQWTFSPSGVPISILTGRIAADQVEKDLKG